MKNSFLSGHTKVQVFVKSLLFMVLFIVLLFAGSMLQMMFPPLRGMFMYGTLGCFGGLIAIWLFIKLESQYFAAIGMVWESKTPLRFIYGLLIGAIVFAFMVIPLLGFSELTITYKPGPFRWSSLMLYVALLPLALMEEIGFRSYPLVKLNKSFGVWTSQFVVAVAFAAYHILNGWGIYGSFTGPFVWAFVFGLSALWSRGIAMSTGIHMALNILQNALGLKGGKASIWKLDYPVGTSQAVVGKTETIGLALQVTVLIVALGATWWYARNRDSNNRNLNL